MKNKSIISILIACLSLGISTSSCEDMLDTQSAAFQYPEEIKDSLYYYWGVLAGLQDVACRQVVLNEVRSDLVTTTNKTTSKLEDIAQFNNPQDGSSQFLQVADYYAIINNCNAYLKNVNLNAQYSNKYYMRAEYRQIQIIRAWTYMQLVNLYGRVPYMTEPVMTLSVVEDFDGAMIDKNNLLDIFGPVLEPMCGQVADEYYNLPFSGNTSISYNNGSTTAALNETFFYPELVLGDMYLMAGQYAKAAQSYYTYLSKSEKTALYKPASCSANQGKKNGVVEVDNVSYSSNGYTSLFTAAANDEIITYIPGAANKKYGTVLTAHVNVMGWSTKQQNSGKVEGAESSEDEEEEAEDAQDVKLSFTADSVQITPSPGFYSLSKCQIYLNNENPREADDDKIVIGLVANGDARKNPEKSGNAKSDLPIVRVNTGGDLDYQVINKFTNDQTLCYAIPVYRKSQVYLRFAEAVNRAGYPSYAYVILKDGLCAKNLPTITAEMDSVVYEKEMGIFVDEDGNKIPEYEDDGVTVKLDDNGDPIFRQGLRIKLDDNGDPIAMLDADGNEVLDYYRVITSPDADNNGAPYVDSLELASVKDAGPLFFLDVTSMTEYWSGNTSGVHARGCGAVSGDKYTQKALKAGLPAYDYYTLIKDATGTDVSQMGAKERAEFCKDHQTEIMNLVEDRIIDESGLELAFEGYRFSDLLRYKDHKNQAGLDGNEWFAKKIASRTIPCQEKEKIGEIPIYEPGPGFDATLYGKMKDPANWYLSLPASWR